MKLKSIATVLVLLAGALTTMAAEPEAVSYKGLPLGSSIDAFQEKLADYQCSGKLCRYNRNQCAGTLEGISEAASNAYMARLDGCKERTSFGGALVTDATAFFTPRGLDSLILAVPSKQMEDLAATVQQKYGLPTETDEAPFLTRAGVQFPNWVKVWKVGEDFLSLNLRSGMIDEGAVQLVSAANMQDRIAAREKKMNRGAQDF